MPTLLDQWGQPWGEPVAPIVVETPQALTTEPSDPTATGESTQTSAPVSKQVKQGNDLEAFMNRLKSDKNKIQAENNRERTKWQEQTREQVSVVKPPRSSRRQRFIAYIAANFVKNFVAVLPIMLVVIWLVKKIVFYATSWFSRKPVLIGDMSWLLIILFVVIVSALLTTGYFLSNLSKFVVVVGPDEVGIQQYDGQFYYSWKKSKTGSIEKSYACLATGWYGTAFGDTILKFPKKREDFTFSTHTMLVQSAAAIASPTPVRSEELTVFTVEAKGSIVLRPDTRDFRSVVVLENITGGLKKAFEIIDKAFARQTELYLASPSGPHTMTQASAMDQLAADILILRIEEYLIRSGVCEDSSQINIRPPKNVLLAIEAAAKEAAEYEKDQQNSRSITASAKTYLGFDNPDDPEAIQAYREAMRQQNNVPIILGAINNGTIGANSPLKVIEIKSNNSNGPSSTGDDLVKALVINKELSGEDKDGK